MSNKLSSIKPAGNRKNPSLYAALEPEEIKVKIFGTEYTLEDPSVQDVAKAFKMMENQAVPDGEDEKGNPKVRLQVNLGEFRDLFVFMCSATLGTNEREGQRLFKRAEGKERAELTAKLMEAFDFPGADDVDEEESKETSKKDEKAEERLEPSEAVANSAF